MVEQVPVMVGGEAHGRLGAYVIFENMRPITHHVIMALLLLSLVVLAVAIADLILRGRFRNTAFALTGMLTLLAPLLGVFAAANAVMFYCIEALTRGISDFLFIGAGVAEGALTVALGAIVGVGAVILRTVLKLVDARRSRSPRLLSNPIPEGEG